MSTNFFSGFKQFFKGYSVQTRKSCKFCGGGRCLGLCGGGLAKLNQLTVQGTLHLNSDTEASINRAGETLMTFDPASHFGRMILKKCQPGESCQVQGLVSGVKMEKLISVKKINP